MRGRDWRLPEAEGFQLSLRASAWCKQTRACAWISVQSGAPLGQEGGTTLLLSWSACPNFSHVCDSSGCGRCRKDSGVLREPRNGERAGQCSGRDKGLVGNVWERPWQDLVPSRSSPESVDLRPWGWRRGRLEPRSPLAHSVVAAGPVRQGASLGSSALVGLRLPRWCSDHEEGHRGQL